MRSCPFDRIRPKADNLYRSSRALCHRRDVFVGRPTRPLLIPTAFVDSGTKVDVFLKSDFRGGRANVKQKECECGFPANGWSTKDSRIAKLTVSRRDLLKNHHPRPDTECVDWMSFTNPDVFL